MAVATADLAEQMLSHTPHRHNFTFTPYLLKTYHHRVHLDIPICKAWTEGHCPLGSRCPDRHPPSAATNKQDGGGAGPSFGQLVCKHWLRGLCKKGETCEFLHEYNLRKMPECNFFVRNGYCSNGDECLYLHIDPQSKLPPCPHYERGFCPLGPLCAKKHVRRKMCANYLCGFCPAGRQCKEGAHPRWETDLEKPRMKEDKPEEEVGVVREEEQRERERERDGGRERDRDGEYGGRDRHGHKDRFGGGRGGRWRGKGGRGFRGKH